MCVFECECVYGPLEAQRIEKECWVELEGHVVSEKTHSTGIMNVCFCVILILRASMTVLYVFLVFVGEVCCYV